MRCLRTALSPASNILYLCRKFIYNYIMLMSEKIHVEWKYYWCSCMHYAKVKKPHIQDTCSEWARPQRRGIQYVNLIGMSSSTQSEQSGRSVHMHNNTTQHNTTQHTNNTTHNPSSLLNHLTSDAWPVTREQCLGCRLHAYDMHIKGRSLAALSIATSGFSVKLHRLIPEPALFTKMH